MRGFDEVNREREKKEDKHSLSFFRNEFGGSGSCRTDCY